MEPLSNLLKVTQLVRQSWDLNAESLVPELVLCHLCRSFTILGVVNLETNELV